MTAKSVLSVLEEVQAMADFITRSGYLPRKQKARRKMYAGAGT